MTDLERFRSLFTQQVQHTWEFVRNIAENAWTAIPVDSDTNFMGTRIQKITILSLLKHLCVVESYWFEQLPLLPANSVLPVPPGTEALQNINTGSEMLARYREMHLRSMQDMSRWTEADLDKEFTFVHRKFTVRGFLRAIHGHHSFHLGQLDLLLRQQGYMPPEYLELAERQSIIA